MRTANLCFRSSWTPHTPQELKVCLAGCLRNENRVLGEFHVTQDGGCGWCGAVARIRCPHGSVVRFG